PGRSDHHFPSGAHHPPQADLVSTTTLAPRGEHTVMSAMRIVSLIPSGTEIVCALGFQQSLVGRSHECDYPDGVDRLPICTAPKFDPHGSSAEIDRRVKTILR